MNNLKDLPDLWTNLEHETRPIVLYGMGDGADKIVTICNNLGINIAGVFASDDFVRHNVYNQWTVKKLSELEQELGEMVVLLAFGSAKTRVLDFVDQVAARHQMYIPDLPVAGQAYFDKSFLNLHWEDFQKAYGLFEDELSKATFMEMLYYKLTGERKYLLKSTVSREQMFCELFRFNENEIFVDAGAYRGDTIDEFIGCVNGQFSKIYALEPDGKNYKKLRQNTQSITNISILEAAAWKAEELLFFPQKSGRGGKIDDGIPNTRAVAIDSVVENHTATYIKYDVEGAELNALEGSLSTIQKSYPKLLISAYHRPEDLFSLPLWVKKNAPNYKFYLRRNHGYPAWDINLICICAED